MNFKELIGKDLNIVCLFGNSSEPIYYFCKIVDVSDDSKLIKVIDKYNKVIILSSDSIKQIKVLDNDTNK